MSALWLNCTKILKVSTFSSTSLCEPDIKEMQIDEESRNAIYDMCDALATHHGIPRFDAVMEDNGDGTHTVSYYGKGIAEGAADTNFKPKLKLVVDNNEEDDDNTIH